MGKTQQRANIRGPLFVRLIARLERNPSGCWVWQGPKNSDGYGTIGAGGRRGKGVYCHRLMWSLVHGPIPDGMCVLHRCDVPACVNPDHLFLGTIKDNNYDMLRKGRGRPLGRTIIDQERVGLIRERHARGDSARDIAASLGISHRATLDVISRRTWQWL